MANIKEHIESLPLRYNTKVGANGIGLSQRQKQRLLIARAVYKNPQYLLIIPRYLVFDESGIMFSSDFVRPSDIDFERKLKSLFELSDHE